LNDPQHAGGALPGTLGELAEELGNLRYDALAEFLNLLATKLDGDATQYEKRGCKRLAKALRDAATGANEAATAIQRAWKICEPHM
jgi:monomeric isocitrate dehydrogenase